MDTNDNLSKKTNGRGSRKPKVAVPETPVARSDSTVEKVVTVLQEITKVAEAKNGINIPTLSIEELHGGLLWINELLQLKNKIKGLEDKKKKIEADLSLLLKDDDGKKEKEEELTKIDKEISELSEGITSFTEEDKVAQLIHSKSREFHRDTIITPDKQSNDNIIDGTKLGPRNSIVKKIPVGVVTGNLAMGIARNQTGMIIDSVITLLNSGFTLYISPFRDSDIIAFFKKIEDVYVSVSSATGGLLLDNYAVILKAKILEFIEPFFSGASIDVPLSEIKNYILPQDMDAIVLAATKMIYPKGVKVNISCKNSMVPIKTEDGKTVPKCNKSFSAIMDPNGCLINIGKDKLTHSQIITISKTIKNTVSVEEIHKYREDMVAFKDKTFTITHYNGGTTTFTLGVPENIVESMNDVNLFINVVEKEIDNIFVNGTAGDDESRPDIEKLLVAGAELTAYLNWFKSIEMATAIVTDKPTLLSVLQIYSESEEFHTIREQLFTYMHTARMSYVGLPEYVCPSCGEKNTGDSLNEFIPIDIVLLFIVLGSQRIEGMTRS